MIPLSSLSRLNRIRRVFKQHGLAQLFRDLQISPTARFVLWLGLGSNKRKFDDKLPQRIRRALEELGPVFIKLGQALSTRPDLIPPDFAIELSKLQDQVPPFDGKEAERIARNIFAAKFDETFETFESQPLASASVAQVHAARLRPGLSIAGKNGISSREVIVKILRPGIKSVIQSDLEVMHTLARLLQRHWSRGNQFRPIEVIEEYDRTIHAELDLRQEAANCSQMAANFEDSDLVYVPQIYWDYCSEQILVMERIYGTPISDLDRLRENEVDFRQLANDGVAVFFKQAFEDNFFHADMHPGNIFVSEEGRWISVDFGIMGTLSEEDKRYLAEMFLGFFNRDYRAIADAHFHAGWIPEETNPHEFESAIRMVCEPNFAKPISEISFGVVLLQLFQTVRRFEIPVQPQLILLYKTLLNIEGLGRQIYPDLNLWDTAKPFLERWMKQQLSPQQLLIDARREWPRWRAVLPKIPQLIERAADTSKAHKAPSKTPINRLFVIGMVLAIVGVVITLLHSNDVIATNWLTDSSLWIALVGLVFACIGSGKQM